MMNLKNIFYRIIANNVGTDQFGHQYYEAKYSFDYLNRRKRFVIYDGLAEPSKIPPKWHAWLHRLINDIPDDKKNFFWQKDHQPNLSGTNLAYTPYQNNVVDLYNFKNYNRWQPKIKRKSNETKYS